MVSSKFDYAIERPSRISPALDRNALQIFIGRRISEMEAKTLLHRIADHKWYVGEMLDRDVGYYVAAIDYIENFYQPQTTRQARTKIAEISQKAAHAVGKVLKSYLTVKGSSMPI